MSAETTTPDASAAPAETVIDLKNPLLATVLAAILPGLGHLYQGRTGKGILFAVCILGTYFYGWFLGGSKVVYAAWEPPQMRHYAYLCQVWVGLPAWPAMIQATFNAPLGPNFMVPPASNGGGEGDDDLALWNRRYSSNFELGTVLTMIAGLLNVLAVFDAAAGPVGSSLAEDEEAAKKSSKKAGAGKPPPGTA